MRCFNITGSCNSEEHYMVDLRNRLREIRKYVDGGKYFVINKGRQYGKTTTLNALAEFLKKDYIVISLDFQGLSSADFEREQSFVKAFARELCRISELKDYMSDEVVKEIKNIRMSSSYVLGDLFAVLNDWCAEAPKPVVLLIDEVDYASNNQVFLDFLAQLRRNYLERNKVVSFRSVILAGVHDIRNLRRRIRSDDAHKHNSPWNIAASFDVEMSFLPEDIATMLTSYEEDHHTGMDITRISEDIYSYTSGYPVLCSSICKHIDENIHEWTSDGVRKAYYMICSERTVLIDSLINKLEDDPELNEVVRAILFEGREYSYSVMNDSLNYAVMYGFIRNEGGNAVPANKVFEKAIYEWYLNQKYMDEPIRKLGENDKNQFVDNGILNIELVLKKFALHFGDLYEGKNDKFKEEDGRRFFLLYLRPIINGTGNFYIESETRNNRRTDVIVDYNGRQYIIELKIWHGEEYNTRGEKQLSDYLDYYHLSKGYMISFCFNKNKKVGVDTISIGYKVLIEAVV